MSNLYIAADPELFVTKDGKISSIAGVLGYGKTNKLDLGNGVRIQEDNVLLEFDIDPSDTFSSFDGLIRTALTASETAANSKGFGIDPTKASHFFTKDEIMSFHKSALEFGCEPDYNALTGALYEKDSSVHPGLRTAGGHVHLGWSHFHEVEPLEQKVIAVMCDYFLGLPSLLLDSDDTRRQLYGKAGCTRFKDYGIEYRSLSNFWINNKDNREFVWDQAKKAFSTAISAEHGELFSRISPEEIQRVINENDKKLAQQYINLLKVA